MTALRSSVVSPTAWPKNAVAGDRRPDWRPLHARDHVAHLEPQARIQTERPGVVGGLEQPHPGEAALGSTIEDILHEQATDADLLDRGVDRDGTDAGDGRPFVEEVAADDGPVA